MGFTGLFPGETACWALLWSTGVWGKLRVPAWAPHAQSCVTCIGSTKREREREGGRERGEGREGVLDLSVDCELQPRLLFPHPCPRLSSLGCHDSRALGSRAPSGARTRVCQHVCQGWRCWHAFVYTPGSAGTLARAGVVVGALCLGGVPVHTRFPDM